MSPLFGDKEEKAARDAATRAEIDRLLALPVVDLASEIMPAFGPGGTSSPNLSVIEALLPGEERRTVHASEVSFWLLRSFPTGRQLKYSSRLSEPVEEGLQALEHAGLVKSSLRVNPVPYEVTRLGETALAEGSVLRHLTPTWIAGRATLTGIERSAHGGHVNCALTLNVLLVDGTPKYEATWTALIDSESASRFQPGHVMLSVRVDPADRSQVVVAWGDPIPVVPTTNPDLIERPQRVLRDGESCRVVVLGHAHRNFLKTPSGEEVYGLKVRVTADSSEVFANGPVPADAAALIEDGKELPAKRLADEPSVVAIDWNAARTEAAP